GGGTLTASVKRFKCYKIEENDIIYIKHSKLHEKIESYWYGIGSLALEYCDQYQVTHIVFVMGEEGLAKVPLNLVKQFITNTKVSKNEDGSIRHYHCYISQGPEPELYIANALPKFNLSIYYQPF